MGHISLVKMLSVGCCGFPVSMKKYFQTLKLVEIQKTFYKPPKVSTACKWRENSPKDFEFTVKAWQLITHPPESPTYRKAKLVKSNNYGFFKPTKEVFEAWERTCSIAKALNARIVVFQTPRSFKPEKNNITNLRNFFSSISGFKFVWEPRGEWKEEEIKTLCEELKLIHCVDPFVSRQLYGDIAYFRLHGIGGYNYRYNKEDLEKLKQLCNIGKPVYCLFNNSYMYQNAVEFEKMSLP